MYATGWNASAAAKQPNAPVEAGYSHSIANIMTNAAVHTGAKATFDEETQEVMADGKVFIYSNLINSCTTENYFYYLYALLSC